MRARERVRSFITLVDNFYHYFREAAEQLREKTRKEESFIPPLHRRYESGLPFKLLSFILALLFIPTILYSTTITSTATGDWNVGSTWGGGDVPISSDNVIIASGHTVTLINDVSMVDLTVVSGGKLTDAGTMKSITCTGNLDVDGSIVIDNDLVLSGTGTSIEGIGSIITSTIVYVLGNKTVLATADITFSGATAFFIDCPSFVNNGKITIACPITGGENWYQGINATFVYNSSVAMLADLYVSTAGNTVDYKATGPQNALDPVDISYFNLKISGSDNVTLPTNIDVNGDLVIDGTAQLNANGNNIKVGGNWTNTSTHADPFVQGIATVTFDGGTTQTIDNINDESFYNLIVNKAGGQLLLASNTDIVISNALTLTSGIIKTDNFTNNEVKILDNATSTSGNVNSYVSGKIRKTGNDAFTFPLGDANGSVWARLGMSAPSLATTEYTAQYFFAPYPDATSDATLFNASVLEYWTLDQSINDDDVQVTLYYEDSARSRINDCSSSNLVVAHFNGTDWTDEGQSSIACGDPGNLTSNVVANYSPFTFGSKSPTVNPLPIELLSFNAKLNGDQVDLNWTTVSETNNDYFTVEKSGDGIDYERVMNIDGAGNSNQSIYYAVVDPDIYHGCSYYRLKQTDYDGQYAYSNTVIINYGNSDHMDYVTIHPNPASGDFSIGINGKKDEEVLVVVLDLWGNMYYSKVVMPKDDTYTLGIDSSGKLLPGVYMVVASSRNELYRKKLVIQ